MKRFWSPLALAALFILLVLCSGVIAHGADARLPLPDDITMEPDAGRGELLYVPVRLESGEELPFVVDTGSSVSMIDKSLEPKLGKRLGTMKMESWGATTNLPLYALPKLYLGGALLKARGRIVAYDFTRMSAQANHPIKGMLSIDCLRHYCFQLDFQAGKMRFFDTNQLDRTNLGKAFPINFNHGARPFLEHVALVPGNSTNELIDTGFDVDGRVETDAIHAEDSSRVHLPQCVWDGETYTNLIVGHSDTANLLGLRFLARHLVTLDFPNQTLYLKKTSIGPLGTNASKSGGRSAATP